MAKTPPRRYPPNRFTRPFLFVLGLTAALYVLRGFQVVTFFPGGVLVGLAALSLLLFIGWGLTATRW